MICVALLVVRPFLLSAQESSCDIPLVVTRFAAAKGTVEPVADLMPKDLSVSVGGSPSTVKDASVDGGSKRVTLILDASRRVPKDEWRLETEMAVNLIENARALDRFSLSLIGVDTPTGPFLPLGDVQGQLRDMAFSVR